MLELVRFAYEGSTSSDRRYFFTVLRARPVRLEISRMATRVWPETARIEDPITEAEFKSWVLDQLTVFESFDEPQP